MPDDSPAVSYLTLGEVSGIFFGWLPCLVKRPAIKALHIENRHKIIPDMKMMENDPAES